MPFLESFLPSRERKKESSQAGVIHSYLDAENDYTYPGHTLANFYARQQISEVWSVDFVINNLLNTDYADRADFNGFSNQQRYFIGEPRSFKIAITGAF